MAVGLRSDIAHMDETGIEDQLIVINATAGEDQTEGLDKAFACSKLAAANSVASVCWRGATDVKVGC